MKRLKFKRVCLTYQYFLPELPIAANVKARAPARAIKQTLGHRRPTLSRQKMVNILIGSSNAADIEYAG